MVLYTGKPLREKMLKSSQHKKKICNVCEVTDVTKT